MSETLSNKPITWASLGKVLGSALISAALTVGPVYLNDRNRLHDVERIATENGRALDRAIAEGKAQRLQVEAASAQRHQGQQAELDQLRLKTETLHSTTAVLGSQLATILDLLKEVRAEQRAALRPPVVEVQPAPVVVPPPSYPQTRFPGLAPAPFGAPLPPRTAR